MVNAWMSWENGVDLVALSSPEVAQPNVIVHLARMVHTPVGRAPAGIVLIPGADGAPQVIGFVCPDPQVGAYFGPHIFGGTPFESAPVLVAQPEFESGDGFASVRLEVEGHLIESRLEGLGAVQVAERGAGALPFHERALEAPASKATLLFNGREIALTLPLTGMSGGPPAVWAPCGMYWR